MKAHKVIGVLFFVYALCTLVGMAIDIDIYWRIYNYVTLVFSITGGIVLLKQK